MEIGGKTLRRLLRSPYLCEDYVEYSNLKKDEQEEYKKWEEKRNAIIIENSKKIFDKDFLQEYDQKIKSLNPGFNKSPIKLLCREFGFDMSKHLQKKWQIKTLQIGCGPGDGFYNGPNLDKILLGLGADTMNLDILDVTRYYPRGRFQKGSWLDIDKYFEKESFDAIFMDNMHPDISDEIIKSSQGESSNLLYQSLILKTMSRIRWSGIFFVSGTHGPNFSIPEHVNDVIETNFIEYNSLSPGMQIYKNVLENFIQENNLFK